MSNAKASPAMRDMLALRAWQLQHGLQHNLFTPAQEEAANEILRSKRKEPPVPREPQVRNTWHGT
jgi:hypothetical protein